MGNQLPSMDLIAELAGQSGLISGTTACFLVQSIKVFFRSFFLFYKS